VRFSSARTPTPASRAGMQRRLSARSFDRQGSSYAMRSRRDDEHAGSSSPRDESARAGPRRVRPDDRTGAPAPGLNLWVAARFVRRTHSGTSVSAVSSPACKVGRPAHSCTPPWVSARSQACSSKLQQQVRDLARVNVPNRGRPGTNGAQRGALRHSASKGLGFRVPLAPRISPCQIHFQTLRAIWTPTLVAANCSSWIPREVSAPDGGSRKVCVVLLGPPASLVYVPSEEPYTRSLVTASAYTLPPVADWAHVPMQTVKAPLRRYGERPACIHRVGEW
jgi:hypothetical protein